MKRKAKVGRPATKPAKTDEPESDSDDSVLEALAAFLDRGNDLPDSDQENQSAERKTSFLEKDTLASEISKLSATVASSSKYAEGLGQQVEPHQRNTEETLLENFERTQKTELKQMQDLETAVGVHIVREAVDSLSHQNNGVFPVEKLDPCMKSASSTYAGLLSPEEEAEEGILALAGSSVGTEVPAEVLGTRPLGNSELQTWAKHLGNTTLAFHSCSSTESGFFASRSMDASLERSISLVHFIEESEHPENPDGTGSATASLVQFVHWDLPMRYWGRRLRIEKGRFVWKPPARVVGGKNQDDISHLFTAGLARIILHDVGASLVKARGQFRTNVPPSVLVVYNTLMACCVESGESDYGPCFVCQEMVNFRCPLCNLWSHESCLLHVASSSLTATGASCDKFEDEEAPIPLNTARYLLTTYQSASQDWSGNHLASLTAFDSADSCHSKGQIGPLTTSSCLLCKGTLQVWEREGMDNGRTG